MVIYQQGGIFSLPKSDYASPEAAKEAVALAIKEQLSFSLTGREFDFFDGLKADVYSVSNSPSEHYNVLADFEVQLHFPYDTDENPESIVTECIHWELDGLENDFSVKHSLVSFAGEEIEQDEDEEESEPHGTLYLSLEQDNEDADTRPDALMKAYADEAIAEYFDMGSTTRIFGSEQMLAFFRVAVKEQRIKPEQITLVVNNNKMTIDSDGNINGIYDTNRDWAEAALKLF